MSHYTDFSSFTEANIGFAQYPRAEGLKNGIDVTKTSFSMPLQHLWKLRPYFQHALSAVYCTSPEEKELFNVLYDRFWNERGHRQRSRTLYKNQSNIKKKSSATLAMLGRGKSRQAKLISARTTSGASRQEALQKTDFALVQAVDAEELESICLQLAKEMSLRLRRKFKIGQKGKIDLAKTIRKSVAHGGEYLELCRRQKRKEKFRLVLLLDVSGSMDKYSLYLLRFMYALKRHFRSVEAFTFSSKLIRITEQLSHSELPAMLQSLSNSVDHWSSGTKIGACLKTFNKTFAKRMLNGRSITIILSDGLDTGESDDLTVQVQQIRRRTKQLIWLNPLKGMKGYQPIQRGMKAALPHLDNFLSAHNLESLLTLENIIADA